MSDQGQKGLSTVKRALLELRELKTRVQRAESLQRDPIAVVGMGLRFPGGADSPETFWKLLHEGRDAITEIPPGRWDVDAYFDPDPDAPGKMHTRHGGFLDQVDGFDARFFGISPREAETMDPQQRLLLELCWEALEHSGHAPDRLAGSRTGVFLGLSNSDYDRRLFAHTDRIDPYFATGTTFSVAAGRISYLLDLRGPAVAVDTACSSSLTAIHQACQSLRLGECDVALAGGVNLILSPEATINFTKARMMAPDGRCKTFDRAADGYVRSEGGAVIVLRRLTEANEDGDTVHALIRGSAMNQDGRSGGLTAPNGPSQTAVIRSAIEAAGLTADDLDYLEAHGTGTSLGDSIEALALGETFAGRADPLRIGSVKTNLGHLEAAAGIAGLLKIVLAMGNDEIPPHLHLSDPNPNIPWSELPLEVPTGPSEWKAASDRPRRAGVSSFGFSGTNVHVILEAPDSHETPATDPPRPRVLPLSARGAGPLRETASRFSSRLSASPESVADICFTAGVGRSHLSERLAIVGSDAAELSAALECFGRNEVHPGLQHGVIPEGEVPQVAFLFSGQGSAYAGMGRELYDSEPVFRETIDRADERLRPALGRSLRELMFDDDVSILGQTRYAQPALFAVEVALAELWMGWGVRPAAVLGHSVGELAAACVAGVFSFEDGLDLAAERGRLMEERLIDGAMAAVFAPEDRVGRAIEEQGSGVAIAAVNARDNTVVSGDRNAVDELLRKLEASGLRTKRLDVSRAFHSSFVDPMLDALETAAARVTYSSPKLPMMAALTGEPAAADEIARSSYWRRQAREPVRFAPAMNALERRGCTVFLEIGPGAALTSAGSGGSRVMVPSLRHGRHEPKQIAEAIARLYVAGVDLDWERRDVRSGRRRLALPTYPFERRRYWFEVSDARKADDRADSTERWGRAIESATRRSNEAPLDLDPSTFGEKWNALGRLALAYQCAALRELGVFGRSGERASVGELRDRLGIYGTYEHLMLRWLRNLVSHGILRRDGDDFVADAALPSSGLEDVRREAKGLFVDYPELLLYVEHCGESLPKILGGKSSPLETLFPRGSFDMAEGLYEHSAPARYFNSILRAAVGGYVSATPTRHTVRVLEIGAGTGGTTGSALAALPADRSAYWFTDVSNLFLDRAARKFGDHPNVRYERFDVEEAAEGQGFESGSFDIVLAANVLHATRNLDRTVDNVRSLLAPGGILLVLETTEHPTYFDITTGLIEGWQSFDDELRGDHPLIPAPGWVDLLTRRGFADAVALPLEGAPTEILGNHVIAARAPGEAVIEERHEDVAGSALAVAEPTRASVPVPSLAARVERAPEGERHGLLVDFVVDQVAAVLKLARDQRLDPGARLLDAGLDSLMAVELRDRLSRGLGVPVELPATLVFDYPTPDAVAAFLDRDVLGRAEVPPPAPDTASSKIEGMSDDEVQELLLQKLEGR